MKMGQMINFIAAAQDIHKVVKVVLSCNKPEHCDVAMNYMRLWSQKHNLQKTESIVLNAFLHATLRYLQDTREHAEKGWHKPEHDGWKTVRTWPDINEYIGGILRTKFPRHWSKDMHIEFERIDVQ